MQDPQLLIGAVVLLLIAFIVMRFVVKMVLRFVFLAVIVAAAILYFTGNLPVIQ